MSATNLDLPVLISAEQIRRREFVTIRRGYDPDQVRAYLEQLADQMDKTEEDIVNKQISIETLKRQEEILTRLLEAEESERKRKQDNERKSNTANEINRPVPPAIEEYLKKRNAELDLYKTVSPELKPFYKNLVEEYLRSISY